MSDPTPAAPDQAEGPQPTRSALGEFYANGMRGMRNFDRVEPPFYCMAGPRCETQCTVCAFAPSPAPSSAEGPQPDELARLRAREIL